MKTIIITVGDEAKYIIGEESSKKSFLGPCSFVFVVSCVACQLLRVSFCYTMVCALLYKYAISCCACAFVYIVSYGACAFVDVLYSGSHQYLFMADTIFEHLKYQLDQN
jgi:hypothetical protein